MVLAMGAKTRNSGMRRAGSFANYGVSAIAIRAMNGWQNSFRGELFTFDYADALAAPAPDPIFAVIEAHRRAWADFVTECGNQAALEEEISDERRHYSIEAGDDPGWIALQQTLRDASDRADAIAGTLLEIEPTTIAGVRGLCL
jgi:hypothetical protein